ncbi:restriction modification system DNA specificity domain protein [Desulfobulbus propionicus DSM 2032]|uniref:Restriction modification system DNA specificity domain protein n=2 Tax=Desulfobulbus propionicus TaxID=894 RepID=A0A7U3YJA8_DESPD|nr:restriction modification system DNA specificity domain protein [Desulfobulbus propionicus DSM 2032]
MVETHTDFNIWSPLAAIRCNPSRADKRFIYFYLQSKEFQTGVELSWSFGTQQNIGMGVIQNLAVPLGTIPEQTAIADFLDRETGRIDTLVTKKRRLIALLGEKRTALISRTVTRGLPAEAAREFGLKPHTRFKDSGIEWLGEVPEGWEVVKFSREVKIAEGQVDPEREPYSTMVLIGPEHVEAGTGRLVSEATAEDQAAISGKYYCHKGEVIYSKIRPALRKVVKAKNDCLCSADMYPLGGRDKLLNDYIYWLFLSDQFAAWSVLEADRVAMPKINRNTLNELRLPVPVGSEQAAIATYLNRETAKIDQLFTKVEAAIVRLLEYRTALITAAVTGKIDVRGKADKQGLTRTDRTDPN